MLDFLSSVWQAMVGAWRLDPGAGDWSGGHPLSLEVGITIAVLAGISTLLGDSAVLFFNRVRGLRFCFTLLLNGVAMVGLYGLQALVLAILGPLMLGHSPGFATVLRGVMLSTAPLVFGVFVLVPYFGPAIARLLQAWGVVVLWVVIGASFEVEALPSLWLTLTGWGVMQLLSWAFTRPVSFIGDKIWFWVTGRPSMLTGRDLLSGYPFQPLAHRFDPKEVH